MLARAADPVPPLLYLCLENPWLLNAGGLIRKWLGYFRASTFFAGLPMPEESLSRFEWEGPRTTQIVANRNRPKQR